MKTDMNMGLIKHKIRYETPNKLCDLVSSSRSKTSPIIVRYINIQNQSIFGQ